MGDSRLGATPPLDDVPMMQADIPPEMFLHPINFDKAQKGKNTMVLSNGKPSNPVTSHQPHDEGSDDESLEDASLNKSQLENTMDMLEQRQAMEQARLLQRFKELRQWQMQQQEKLMKQQQMQLEMLKHEQESAQGLIVKHREKHWGGKVKLADSSMRTPPRALKSYSHRGQGHPHQRGQGQMQPPQPSQVRQGQLPAPVMYVPLNDDNDEIRTNPDLFSDTNSQAGSHVTAEDGFVPLPDSASETGVRTKLTFMEDDDLDEGIGTQSIQSPGRDHVSAYIPSDREQGGVGIPGRQGKASAHVPNGWGQVGAYIPSASGPVSARVPNGRVQVSAHVPDGRVQVGAHVPSAEVGSPEVDHGSQSDLEEQGIDDSEDEDNDDQEEEEEEEEDDENEEDDLNIDDRPVMGTMKTFEELLEEQLRAEEEKLRLNSEKEKKSEGSPKRHFLKKGQGIARFGLSDKPASLPSTATVKSTLPEGAKASSVKRQNRGVKKKQEEAKPPQKTVENKQPQKTLSLKKSSPKKQQPSKNSPRDTGSKFAPLANKGKTSKPTEMAKPVQTSKEKSQKLEALNAKMLSKEKEKETLNLRKHGSTVPSAVQSSGSDVNSVGTGKNKSAKVVKSSAPDSIPDDESFVGRVMEREKNEELEKEDLEEFELLENFADNMSFCSNSSLVVRVLERDRNQRAAPLKSQVTEPKVPEQKLEQQSAQSQSPRTTVAKQLEATLKKGGQPGDPFSSDPLNDYSVRTLVGDAQNSDLNKRNTHTQEKGLVQDFLGQELGHKIRGRLSDVHEDLEGEDRENEEEEDSESESSESESEDTTDSDSESDNSNTLTSPSKIMTRKIASSRDRTTGNVVSTDRSEFGADMTEKTALTTVNSLLQRLASKQGATQLSADFSLPMKSPIVISKEAGEYKNAPAGDDVRHQNVFSPDSGFRLHGQLSSHEGLFRPSDKARHKNDEDGELSDGSVNSYTDLKISGASSLTDVKQVVKDNRVSRRDEQEVHSKSETEEEDDDDIGDKDEDDKFDDEDEWNDLTPKAKSPAKHNQQNMLDSEEGPPTSKLVSKLFPNLKSQQTKQQIQNQQKLEAAVSTATADGVQSKLMREKLTQLEMEIEKFKNENINLERLRKEREEGLAKLKKEIAAFEKEKSDELRRIQEYKNEEMKKLKHEKKMFEKYQKAAREMPNKKEREEIEMLKTQLSDLQEEMKRKEGRWTSNNARLRSKMELLEQENTELKEEIKLMEMKRLEWLQKEQNAKKGSQRTAGPSNTAYSQQISKQFTSNSADFQTTDSDEETDPVRDESNRLSLQDTMNSNSMSLRPSQYENLVNVRAPAANSKTVPSQQKLPAPSHAVPSKPAAPSKGPDRPQARAGQVKQKPEKSTTAPSKSSRASKSGPPSLLSVSTHLLHEDLPRGKPAVAAHQDNSMYSETETSMVEMPRKTTQKPGLNKSVINKGDKGYDEMTHSDGKVERIYSTGAREILFTNGTRKEISPDGQYISVSFFNGDIKQIMPDQRVIYYYSETQATHTTYPDGLEILQFPNNQVEKHYPDGTKEITFPDQIIKYLFPGGSEESVFPDGTVIKVDRNGDKTIEFPNGQREIHTQEYKRREYPDGTVKTVYPDGKQETRYSNGRIRVKDKDGNIIVDKRC